MRPTLLLSARDTTRPRKRSAADLLPSCHIPATRRIPLTAARCRDQAACFRTARDFLGLGAEPLVVSDFTYVATWSGVVYVAFTIDAFSRRIVGWKADTTMKTPLVLDTLEMALWARDHHGQPASESLIAHSDPEVNTRRLRSPSVSSRLRTLSSRNRPTNLRPTFGSAQTVHLVCAEGAGTAWGKGAGALVGLCGAVSLVT
jgi:transposase InsO family protein